MKRKLIVFIAVILIPFLILLFDHYILSESIPIESTYDDSTQWQYICDHQDEYPPALLKLAVQNKETIPFVAAYLDNYQKETNMDITNDLKSGKIPLFLQWDQRWGYKQYGDNMLAINGCGPTCLAMVTSYLKQDVRYNPYYLAKFAYQKGYYQSAGTSWSFMSDAARYFGINVQEMPLDELRIQEELDNGHPIICSVSRGIFTTEGHFIVLREYKDGLIYVNDPNSQERSQKGYRFDEIRSQIRNLWVYSL